MLLFLSLMIFFSSSYALEEKKISLQEFSKEVKLEKDVEAFFTAIRFSNNSLAMSYIKKNDELENIEYVKKNTFSPMFKRSKKWGKKNILDIINKKYKGQSAVIVAIESKNTYILEQLLKRDVNLDIKHPILGKYPIHTAVYFENYEAVELLLKYNKDFANLQNDIDGWTPLEDLALKGNVPITKLLLSYGANPLIKDYSNNTAIDLATNFGKGAIVKLLRDKVKEIRNIKWSISFGKY